VNPLAFIHLFVGLLMIAVCRPLVRRKIKMNHWYGIRIPAAFESEERWFEINEYGGRLLSRCGVVIAAAAVPEFFLGKTYWPAGALAGAFVMMLALGVALWKIFHYAGVTKKS